MMVNCKVFVFVDPEFENRFLFIYIDFDALFILFLLKLLSFCNE